MYKLGVGSTRIAVVRERKGTGKIGHELKW